MAAAKRKRTSASSVATPERRAEDAQGNDGHNNRDDESQPSNVPDAGAKAYDDDNNEFRVRLIRSNGVKPVKKRKAADETDIAEEPGPEGAANLRTLFAIEPGSKWNAMTRYKNFVVSQDPGSEDDGTPHKFGVGDCIFVYHHDPNADDSEDIKRWVARVCEVRAAHAAAVFVRVAWFYWPEELPSGKEVYHGASELVASNHMDIIDAMTVDGRAKVEHLSQIAHGKQRDMSRFGRLDPEIFYWRQTFDATTGKLSALPRDCFCNRVSNLDEHLQQCPHLDCRRWWHTGCLLDAALRDYWNTLEVDQAIDNHNRGGMDQSQNAVETHYDTAILHPGKEEEGETIVAQQASQSSFLDRIPLLKGFESYIKLGSGKVLQPTDSDDKNGLTHQETSGPLDLRQLKADHAATPIKKPSKKRRKSAAKNDDTARPWDGRLTAELVMDGDVFTGTATIHGLDVDGERKLDVLRTVVLRCPSDKCGKTLYDASTAAKVKEAIISGFELVKDAVNPGTVNGTDVTAITAAS